MKNTHTYNHEINHEKNNEKNFRKTREKELADKMKINNKRKRRKSKYIAVIIFILILLSAGIALLGMSSAFNISEIQAVGAKHCESEEVVKASGALKGTNGFKNIGGGLRNFLYLRYGQAESNILRKFPYIKNVTVRYVLPDKVLIRVEEREPFVLIPYLGAFLLVDNEGYVLETLNQQGDEGEDEEEEEKEEAFLPVVKGLKFTGYQAGQALKMENKENFNMLIILLNALTEEEKNDNFKFMEQIDIIDVSDADNIRVYMDSRLVVNYGDLYDLSYRVKLSRQIIQKNIDDNAKGILDFTRGDYPVFMPAD